MKDRLIELFNKAEYDYLELSKIHPYEKSLTDFTADYILDDGWIRPPCKIGDVVYFVGRNNGKPIGTIDELVIIGIEKTEQGFNAKAKFKDSENVFKILDFNIDNYGFFSTRKEAEAKLNEGVAT